MEKPWDRQKGETVRQFAYFNAYLLLPPAERNISAAARNFHTSLFNPAKKAYCVGTWSNIARKFRWDERAGARDSEGQRQLLIKRDEAEAEYQEKLRQFRYAGLDRIFRALLATTKKIEKISELPAVAVNEKKYRDDGTLEAERKIGRLPQSEIAQLLKVALEYEQALGFGLDPSKGKTSGDQSEGKSIGTATHLELIIEDYVEPDADSN